MKIGETFKVNFEGKVIPLTITRVLQSPESGPRVEVKCDDGKIQMNHETFKILSSPEHEKHKEIVSEVIQVLSVNSLLSKD